MQLRIQHPDGDEQLVTLRADRPLRLGTHRSADIVLRGAGIYPVHVGIKFRKDAFWIVASKSARKVSVNECQVARTALKPGDQIEIGWTSIEVLDDTSDADAAVSGDQVALEPRAPLETTDFPPLEADLDPLSVESLDDLQESTEGGTGSASSFLTEMGPLDDLHEPTGTELSALPSEPAADTEARPSTRRGRGKKTGAAAREDTGPSTVVRVVQSTWFKSLLLVAVVVPLVVLIGLYVHRLPTPEQQFRQADKLYHGDRLEEAGEAFDRFLAWHADTAYGDEARILRDVARLRLALDRGEDAPRVLAQTEQTLEAWGSLRYHAAAEQGLMKVLPSLIADLTRLGKTAAGGGVPDAADKAFGQAGRALRLIYRFVPPRLQQQHDVDLLQIHLTRFERAFNQGAVLRSAVARIEEAGRQGGLVNAYPPLDQLLRDYSELRTNGRVVATMRMLTRAETNRAVIETSLPQPITQPLRSVIVGQLILDSDAQIDRLPSPDQAIAVLVPEAGAVHVVDVASGHVLWRRTIGFETDTIPLRIKDAAGDGMLIVDSLHQQIARVTLRTGQLVWRLPLKNVVGSPVAAGKYILVASRDGCVTQLDPATGRVDCRLRLPQGLVAGPTLDPRAERCYVVADRGVVYVVSMGRKRCLSVHWLGHAFGTVRHAPTVLRNHLVIFEQVGPASSKVHVLKCGDTLEPVETLALGTRVCGEPVAIGTTLYVAGDNGRLFVLRWNADKPRRPMEVGPSVAIPGAERLAGKSVYLASAGGRLWTGALGLTEWKPAGIDSPPAVLHRQWPTTRWVQPIVGWESQLLCVGREEGRAGLVARLWDVQRRKLRWSVRMGVPLFAATEAPAAPGYYWLASVTGAVYRITPEQLASTPDNSSAIPVAARLTPLDDELDVVSRPVHITRNGLLGPVNGGDWLACVLANAEGHGTIRRIALPGRLACPPGLVDVRQGIKTKIVTPDGDATRSGSESPDSGDRWLLALDRGPLCLFDPATERVTSSYLPETSAAMPPRWQFPAVSKQPPFALRPGRPGVVTDGQHRILLVGIGKGGTLEGKKQVKLEVPIRSALINLGGRVLGVDEQNRMVTFDESKLAMARGPTLLGELQWGPVRVSGCGILATSRGRLYGSLGSLEKHWTADNSFGPVVGVAKVDGTTVVLASRSGNIWFMDAHTGAAVLQPIALHQPLNGGPIPLGSNLLVITSDGCLVLVKWTAGDLKLRKKEDAKER